MNSLVGKYRLVAHGVFTPGGEYKATSSYFYGELYYGADGTLYVLINFSRTPESARDNYGYVGTYRIKSQNVVEHRMTVATASKQVNSVEERTFEVRGSELVLGRIFENGDRFEGRWQKID